MGPKRNSEVRADRFSFTRCLCAGGYSSAVADIVAAFNSSEELGTVGLSMYLLGFAVGEFDCPSLSTPLDAHD